MIVVDLNGYDKSLSCGDIARQLAQSGKYHADTPLRFMRGNTKVFIEDLKLVYWINTRIKESTDGEWMKTVRYDNSFQRHSPRQMDSGVGVKDQDDPHT